MGKETSQCFLVISRKKTRLFFTVFGSKTYHTDTINLHHTQENRQGHNRLANFTLCIRITCNYLFYLLRDFEGKLNVRIFEL